MKRQECANCGVQNMKRGVVFKDGILCASCFEKMAGKRVSLLGLKESMEYMRTRIADLSSPDYKGMVCPKCGSVHVELVGNHRKGFSFGKAAGGAFLAGGVGLLAGFAGKKDGTQFFCNTCHKTFKIK